MVSGFIDVSFGTIRGSSADDAIARASLNMNNVQDAIAQRGSNNDHSVGTGAVIKVDGGGVGENGGSFGE